MQVRDDYRSLGGPEKAAVLMLSLDEEHASQIFGLMDDEEIREISQTMANLGTIASFFLYALPQLADPIPSYLRGRYCVLSSRRHFDTNGVR